MIGFPRYLVEQNALVVPGIATPFPAGSLIAVRQGDMLAVASPMDGTLICRWAPFDLWAMTDGSTFTTADAAFIALDTACRRKRSVGEVFGTSTVAGTDLIRGMPVAISRGTGQLLPARADTYALAFVVGVASVDTLSGFADQPAHGAVTLTDWTLIAGTQPLAPGAPYFLAPQGGLTTEPARSGSACVTRVGFAASPTTLIVQPSPPILL